MLYFAYGSNLNIKQMKQRCPDSIGISPAVLNGWKLVERTYADIEEAEAAKTEISGRELCRRVVLKAKEIYNGME